MARKAKKKTDDEYEIRRRKIARYGWVPDLPDARDFPYSAPVVALRALPPKVDLRKVCPPIYDQGELGVARPTLSGPPFSSKRWD